MSKLNEEKIKEILDKGAEKAKELLADDGKMQHFLDSLEGKLRGIPELGDDLAYVPIFASMTRAYIAGEYKQLPVRTIIMVVSSLIYFVSPIDVVPDTIPVLGYTDDAAVLVACAAFIKPDLDRFIEWRDAQNSEDGEAVDDNETIDSEN